MSAQQVGFVQTFHLAAIPCALTFTGDLSSVTYKRRCTLGEVMSPEPHFGQ
jgi:hypothetical protein